MKTDPLFIPKSRHEFDVPASSIYAPPYNQLDKDIANFIPERCEIMKIAYNYFKYAEKASTRIESLFQCAE